MNRVFVFGLAGTLLLGSPVALGQDDDDETARQGGAMEEVVVTARKREEALQDVPFSVAAMTEERMQQTGATSMEDVSRQIAGFTVQQLGPGQSQVAIRGVSAGQIVRDQPGVKEQVGVYLDESVISLSLFTPDLDLYDANRVEVLRGPQGTLFGSGSLSGTVRYITQQPDLDAFDVFGEATATTLTDGDTGYNVKGVINAPLSDNVALRAVGYYRDDPGYIDAIRPSLSKSDDINSSETYGARVALRIEASDQLTITPRIVYQEVDSDGFTREDDFNILANEFTTTRPAVTIGDRETFLNFDESFEDDFFLFDTKIEYDFGNVVLTSITSYTDRDITMIRDATQLTGSITAQPGVLVAGGYPESVYTLDAPLDDSTDVEMFTQEIRLAGTAGDNVDWVGGIFYSTIDRDYGQSLFVDGFEAISGFGPTAGVLNGTDVLFFSDIPYDFDQYAVFGELNWAVNDQWNLTGGLRYFDFDEDRTLNFDGIFAAQTIGQKGSTDSDGFAPRVMASFAMNENVTFNGQISKGFRLGGINDPLNAPLCSPEDLATFGGFDEWDDEELWNYEIGAKTTVLGGRGTFNIAAFYMDIEDLQATLTAGTCSSRIVFNVPDAHSQGIEAEFAAQPTDNFDFAISASYIEAELDDTITSTDAMGNVSIVGGLKDGNSLPTVPELQFAAAGTYSFPFGGRGWEGYVTGVYQWQDDRYTQFGDQSPGFETIDMTITPIGDPMPGTTTFDPELDSYGLLNLRFGARKDAWDVALFVNNVTDEEGELALDFERGNRARVGYLTTAPRTIGLTARVNFQ